MFALENVNPLPPPSNAPEAQNCVVAINSTGNNGLTDAVYSTSILNLFGSMQTAGAIPFGLGTGSAITNFDVMEDNINSVKWRSKQRVSASESLPIVVIGDNQGPNFCW